MATRVRFTSDEDRFLVKYIAKYNPTSKGRAGNTLYQRLCEDVDSKWKWSRTHTWQSWRDRYYKNAQEFDRRIKAYQTKHGILDEEPAKLKKGKDKAVNVVEEEEAEQEAEQEEDVEEDEDEGPAALGKRKRGPTEEGKRAKMKRAPEQSQERKVSKGREQDTFVMGKGSAVASRRGGNLDAQSKSESRPRPTSSDEDRGEATRIVTANGNGEHDRAEKVEVPRIDGPMNDIERAQIRHPSPQPLYPDITKLPTPGLSATSISAPQQATPLPAGYVPPPSTSRVVRHQRQADLQPEASTSKVQLSPSHRIPPGSSIAFQPRRKIESKEDEFFASPLATPSPPDRTEDARPKHRLPMLMEGPFGHRFPERRTATRGHSSSEEDEEKTKTWPPRRKRNISSKDKGKAKEVTRDHNARAEDSATTQKHNKTIDKRTVQGLIQAGAPSGARQPAQVDPLVPSSRTAPQLNAKAKPIRSKTEGKVTQPGRPKSPLRTSKPSKIGSTRQSMSKSDSVQNASALSRSTSGATIPADSETSSSVAEKKFTRTLLPRTSWTPGDPFTAGPTRSSTNLGGRTVTQNLFSRRHTIDSAHNVQNQNKAGRRVDLRAEMAKRLHERSSSVHSRAHSVGTAASRSPLNNSHSTPPTISGPARRRSSLLPIPVADEDREHIEYLGVSKAIEMIANNFGFRDEDVWNAWKVFKNIARTEDFFRRFREKTKAVEAAVLEEMEKDGVDFDALLVEQEEQGAELEPKPQPQPTRQERERSAPSASNERSPSRRTQERDLRIKPLPVERALSEYTPPYMSRAGQYVRLVNQGRKEEAISRENRRASGGSGVFPKLRSQSAARESPQNRTPDTRRDPGSDEKRGEMGEGDYDHLPKKNADEAVVEEELHQEEAMAFLTATPRKAAELRTIEQRMGVDYMLHWTAAQLGRFAQSRARRDRNPPRSAGLEDGE